MSVSAQTELELENEIERLLPVLVHIQAHLDQDLSLEALASQVRLSNSHFHRLFRSAVGETLKQYTQRLRLERAANCLVINDAPIIDVALDSGFQNHETFSRQFKRRFQVTPKEYRRWARSEIKRSSVSSNPMDELYSDFELSKTIVTRLTQLHVAFIRHVGPYESVTDILWHQLQDWANSKRLPRDLIFLGIAHDAPGVTPPERLRFDAAVVVPEEFSPEGVVGHQLLGPGEFAMTTHVGHFRTLPKAYAAIVQRVVRLGNHRVGGLPAIEVYRTTRIDASHEMNHTEIYLPVSRLKK